MPDTPAAKSYASTTHPLLEAVLGELLRLKSEEQAIEWLDMLSQRFIISRHQTTESTEHKSLILWVKGYALTPEEEKGGFTGNFAAVSYRKQDGKWTLAAKKIDVELGNHPHKQYRNTERHPNWGHPLLREIKKKTQYETLAEAEYVLSKLHESYPMASIPNRNKLHLMIFSRAVDREKPIQKYVFEIQAMPEGGFTIGYQLSERKAGPQKKRIKRVISEDAAPKEPMGKFTSQVQLKRKKR